MRAKLIAAIIFMLLIVPGVNAAPSRVLVIINENSAASKEVGAYYVSRRHIPSSNVLRIKCVPGERIGDPEYRTTIEAPVKAYLKKSGLSKTVDYLVLTKGIPFRTNSTGMSVDSLLMCMDLNMKVTKDQQMGTRNPYYGAKSAFSHRKYRFYLATRLDGYTVKDAKALVDRSLAAKPRRGGFLFDSTPSRDRKGYAVMNSLIWQADQAVRMAGYESTYNEGPEFIGAQKNLMGYFSWGSNDPAYVRRIYRSNRFAPGGIAETAVSSGGRTFTPTTEGQSLIADLITSGATGAKGYVSEPGLSAIANPVILFDRYLSGFNLADSYYMASRYICWRDLVIGDPLCAPYAANRK